MSGGGKRVRGRPYVRGHHGYHRRGGPMMEFFRWIGVDMKRECPTCGVEFEGHDDDQVAYCFVAFAGGVAVGATLREIGVRIGRWPLAPGEAGRAFARFIGKACTCKGDERRADCPRHRGVQS